MPIRIPTHARQMLFTAPAALLLAVVLSGCGGQPSKPVEPQPQPDTETRAQEQPIDNTITIAAVGDVMLDGSAREIMVDYGYDFAFVGTRGVLHRADIAMANLEGPLTHEGTPAPDKRFLFRSPPDKVACALKQAGFDVVTLANNHTLDYGTVGLTHTIEALDKYGIAHVGAGDDLAHARRAHILERKGKRIAVLGYSLTFPEEFWADINKPGTAFGHRKHIMADIAAAREQADIVVVNFHWGQESKTELRPYQIGLGRDAINAGAQLVVGHHPHILQAVERYKDGVILYSLGNFAFGSYSRKATTSAIAEMEFTDNKLTRVRLLPLGVFNVNVLFQPVLLGGKPATAVVDEIKGLSMARNTVVLDKDGIAEVQLAPPAQAQLGSEGESTSPAGAGK